MIQISNGKVIIDGKHTTDPTLIGYALLDAAENSIHQFDKNTVTETFYNYELISGTEVSNHNSFELSSEKIIY